MLNHDMFEVLYDTIEITAKIVLVNETMEEMGSDAMVDDDTITEWLEALVPMTRTATKLNNAVAQGYRFDDYEPTEEETLAAQCRLCIVLYDMIAYVKRGYEI